MPIYEYRCAGCGKEFEKYVSRATTAVACPECESVKVMRKLSVVGIRSAGSVMSSAAPTGGGCCGGGCGCQ